MTNAEKARLLRSAASALEHGRYATANKKIAQVSRPYVLITVAGGVADIGTTDGEVGVDILDFDNLESTAAEDARLSDREWQYLKENDPDLYDFFAPSREANDE